MPPKKKKGVKQKSSTKRSSDKSDTPHVEPEISEESFSISEDYSPPKERKTSPYMSIYEYTALLNARTLQISKPMYEDAPKVPLINPEDYDPISIATRELKAGLINLVIRRKLPDGTTEDWFPSEMYLPRI
jgi:DNA-directed RNA polymerase subunit K/omega